ncbi:hypothetical protein [Streptomyces sp. NBC_01500]|uniref:hypothetical protein n=1 Tax=Streptomyces sp. NBC_01500 TaxID=2903886 RepID=UPI00225A52B8|nr:hypothetical protein [Streptomyces sp. NBC_01500]MCX4554160.1 hypothetical protein [Streptomyces sp. NBC_01500]
MTEKSTTSRQSAEAAYYAHSTPENLAALQVAGEAEMNEYLAGFDARNADDKVTEELITDSTPELQSCPEAKADFAGWFKTLIDQNATCTDFNAFERDAYRGHISYGLSMTDGRYAPQDFDAWVIGFRKDPVGSLYQENDARHQLAAQVNSYTRIIRQLFK